MLWGVKLKISEKYQFSEKVMLPVGWTPSDPSELLSFQYNFNKESEVIRLAEEERLIQETKELEENDANQDDALEQDFNSHDEEETLSEKDEDNENDENYENVIETKEEQMLTPFVLSAEDNRTKNDNDHTVKQVIDLAEFESHNQNPFELVELQTLNELDELRCVLDPSEAPKTIKSKAIRSTESASELQDPIDMSIFDKVPVVTTQIDVVVHDLIDTTSTSVIPDNNFTMPHNVANSTLRWTNFDAEVGSGVSEAPVCPEMSIPYSTNPFQPYPSNFVAPNSMLNTNRLILSQSPPGTSSQGFHSQNMHFVNNHSNLVTGQSSWSKYTQENSSYKQETDSSNNEPVPSLTRTKSLPNLQEQSSDYENVSILQNRRGLPEMVNSVTYNKSNEELQFHPADRGAVTSNPVEPNNAATNRIENIMKQFQFQRLPMDTAQATYPTNANYQDNQAVMPNTFSSSQMQLPSTASFPVHPPVVRPSTSLMSSQFNYNFSANNVSYSSPASNYSTSIGSYNPPYLNQNNPFSLPENITSTQPTQHGASVSVTSTSAAFSGQPFDGARTFDQVKSGPMMIQSGLGSSPSEINLNPVNNSRNYENFKPLAQANSNVNSIQKTGTSYPNGVSYQGQLPARQKERVYPVNSFGMTDSAPDISRPVSVSFPVNFQPVSMQPGAISTSISSTHSQPKTSIGYQQQISNKLAGPNSWLNDETSFLSTSEKNFAYQLNAMGFPLPCVSRTVKRLGLDEKEVLDFLCLVQEFKDKGFVADDVEIALLNNEEKEKITPYLEMVKTFKELGFQPKNIHDALKETACDQNKALDYLTR